MIERVGALALPVKVAALPVPAAVASAHRDATILPVVAVIPVPAVNDPETDGLSHKIDSKRIARSSCINVASIRNIQYTC